MNLCEVLSAVCRSCYQTSLNCIVFFLIISTKLAKNNTIQKRYCRKKRRYDLAMTKLSICNSVIFLYKTNAKKISYFTLISVFFLADCYNKHQRDRDNNHCLRVFWPSVHQQSEILSNDIELPWNPNLFYFKAVQRKVLIS